VIKDVIMREIGIKGEGVTHAGRFSGEIINHILNKPKKCAPARSTSLPMRYSRTKFVVSGFGAII